MEFRFPQWGRPGAVSERQEKGEPDAAMTEWCRERAAEFGLGKLSRKVKVFWNPRMRTTAGRAWWPARAIELNPKIREISEDEIWRTLKHELAHLFAYERGGRRKIEPHGREWRVACADLGIPGESVRHSLPLKGRRLKRKHVYVCPSCAAKVSRVREIKRPVACFSCCKTLNGGVFHERFQLVKVDADS